MEGTSFSIPINKVQEIIGDLAAGRPVSHSYIGAAMADWTPSWARQVNANNDGSWKIPEIDGAFVSKVFPDSPAGTGRLQMSHAIIDIGGTKITSSEDA
jgi:S1-C subfamily serine protease